MPPRARCCCRWGVSDVWGAHAAAPLQFFVPFVVNQSGSVLYYYLLGSVDLSMAVPICNSLTFVFTALASRLLGEQQVGPRIIGGMVCILAGVSVCVYSKL